MIYVDTSALMKRYIAEPQSAPFDAFFIAHAPVAASRLTLVEMRCGLARRRRAGHIDRRLEKRALEEMRTDIQDGAIVLYPVGDGPVADAYHLLGRVANTPLRTLDALHLSLAESLGASGFATSDRNQAEAARALGFRVTTFF